MTELRVATQAEADALHKYIDAKTAYLHELAEALHRLANAEMRRHEIVNTELELAKLKVLMGKW